MRLHALAEAKMRTFGYSTNLHAVAEGKTRKAYIPGQHHWQNPADPECARCTGLSALHGTDTPCVVCFCFGTAGLW